MKPCYGGGPIKPYSLVSPNGEVFTGFNLMEFVRENPNLFDAHAVVWKNGSCAAMRGLNSLRPSLPKPTTWNRIKSWNGWRWKVEPKVALQSERKDGKGHWPAGKSRSTLTPPQQERVIWRLRTALDVLGSMREIARRMEVSEKQVRRVLSGEQPPTERIAERTLTVLNQAIARKKYWQARGVKGPPPKRTRAQIRSA